MNTEYKFKFNTEPADPEIGFTCEGCDSAENILMCDSDWGPLTVALCPDCAAADDYDPDAD